MKDANKEMLDSLRVDPESKINVIVPLSTKRRVEDIVRAKKDENPYAKGINISSFVREAIEEKLEKEEPYYRD